MSGQQLGRVHRAIRVRLGLRQQDVSDRSGVRREKVSRLERGDLRGLAVDELQRCFDALGARIDIRASWRGAELDRLLDEGHARLAGWTAQFLRQRRWMVEAEVTYSHYGERGSVDLLAWHPAARMLLVVEIKTELASVEGLLRSLDAKVRLAPGIGRERFGWQAAGVARLVVLPDGRTARRESIVTAISSTRRCRFARARYADGCRSRPGWSADYGSCQMMPVSTLSRIRQRSGAFGGQDRARWGTAGAVVRPPSTGVRPRAVIVRPRAVAVPGVVCSTADICWEQAGRTGLVCPTTDIWREIAVRSAAR